MVAHALIRFSEETTQLTKEDNWQLKHIQQLITSKHGEQVTITYLWNLNYNLSIFIHHNLNNYTSK